MCIRDSAAAARAFGAEGIGLCRTEHMFFETDRIAAIREMIVSKTVEQREAALAKLLPMQRGDFEGIYEAMEGYPVTIRLLDPPLHEFLPHEEDDIVALASEMNISVEELKGVIDSLHEFNPMMGHRGCRLDVTYPEIGAMQTRAIIEAAINVQKRHPEWKLVQMCIRDRGRSGVQSVGVEDPAVRPDGEVERGEVSRPGPSRRDVEASGRLQHAALVAAPAGPHVGEVAA